MGSDTEFGLPKLVVDLLRTKMTESDNSLKWKVVSSGNFTQPG